MPEENQNPTEQPDEVNDNQIVDARFIGPNGGEEAVGSRFIASNGVGEAQPNPPPPEAQGEVNGGPLGCCLGIFIGLMISLPIAVFGRLYANPLVPVFHSALLVLILLRIAMAIGAIAGMVIFGYFGWKIGTKVFREYEPPVIHYRERKRPKRKVAQKKI